MNLCKLLLFTVLLNVIPLIFTSCEDETKSIPPYDQLSEEKFIKIYIELKTVEFQLKKKTTSHHVYREWIDKASDSIFNKYKTQPEVFYGAYDHYMQDPQRLFILFEAALDTVNLRIRSVK